MSTNLFHGIIRNGQVEVAQPLDLPDGSPVTILHGCTQVDSDEDRPRTPAEIAATLAAMDQVEPFDMTDADRSAADAWEQQVNAYTIANLDRGLEDVFP